MLADFTAYCLLLNQPYYFIDKILDQEFPINGFYEQHVELLGTEPMTITEYRASVLFGLLRETFQDRQHKKHAFYTKVSNNICVFFDSILLLKFTKKL